MTNMNGARGIATMSTTALVVMLSACGDDRAAQARAAEGGIVIASASVPSPVETSAVDTTVPESRPSYEGVTYADAETAFRRGRYEESAKMFEVYTAENPDNAFGHYMLGLSAWKAGDHAQAEESLTRAVDLNGETVKIRTNLSRVLLERGRAAEALPHLEKAVELDAESHEVWRVLGNVYAAEGRSVDAIDAYRQALMLNDHDAWTMNNYGLVLIRLGRYDEAVLPLARAVEIVPRSATFQNNLGTALERIGQLEGARGAFTAALEGDSTHAKAAANLERVQTRLVTSPMTAPDLSVFARQFTEDMRYWTIEEEHDC